MKTKNWKHGTGKKKMKQTITTPEYQSDLLMSDYLNNIFQCLYVEQFTAFDECTEFLQFDETSQLLVQRQLLLHKLYRYYFQYHFSVETLYLAINIMDRILSKARIKNFDPMLVSVTCLFTAAKYFEIDAPHSNASAMLRSLSRNRQRHMFALEKQLLILLDFKLTQPTVATMSNVLLAKLHKNCQQYHIYREYKFETMLTMLHYTLELICVAKQHLMLKFHVLIISIIAVFLSFMNETIRIQETQSITRRSQIKIYHEFKALIQINDIVDINFDYNSRQFQKCLKMFENTIDYANTYTTHMFGTSNTDEWHKFYKLIRKKYGHYMAS